MNDQPGSSYRCGGHYVRVAAWTDCIISAHSIIVGGAPIQAGHYPSGYVAHVQVVITVHVAVERVAHGDIQQIAGRATYANPVSTKAAACGHWPLPQPNVSLCRNFADARNPGRDLRLCPGHVRRGARCEWRRCVRDTVLPWQTCAAAERSQSQHDISSKNNRTRYRKAPAIASFPHEAC